MSVLSVVIRITPGPFIGGSNVDILMLHLTLTYPRFGPKMLLTILLMSSQRYALISIAVSLGSGPFSESPSITTSFSKLLFFPPCRGHAIGRVILHGSAEEKRR